MKTNRQSTTIKGFQLEIFKVPNALHVTIANCGSISKCMQFSVSFAGALFYLQDVF